MTKGKIRKRKSRNLTRTEYRSDLEWKISLQLTEAEIPFVYEGEALPYIMGRKVHNYTPDFKLGPDTFLEIKGRFVNLERDSRKLVLIQQQHPEIDLRIVFQRENQAISRDDTTTYAEWAEANGFTWAGKGAVPEEWLLEFKGRLH